MKTILMICLSTLAVTTCKKEKGCVAKLKPDCVHTMEYAPVCGCDGKTYGNRGEAFCNSIEEFTEGPCN